MLTPDEVDTVIYHYPCTDGFGSAFVVWLYFKDNPDKKIEYHPLTIGADPPDNLVGRNVLILDYCFKKDVTEKLLNKVNKLLILDHHKTSQMELNGIDDKYKVLDMNRSGAMLTWDYFFKGKEPLLLIKYIQDRDIWTNKLPSTNDFAHWFHTLPFEFEEYYKYINDDTLLSMIQTKGKVYGEHVDYQIKQAMNYAVPKFCKILNKFYIIVYVNSTVGKSDIGNKLFELYPYADFTAIYSINDSDNTTSFSLRSIDVDVSMIARGLSGGGHPKASGIKINYLVNTLGISYGNIYNSLKNIHYGTLEVDNKTYNVVHLYSPKLKKKIGTYLLQNKYENIQVAQHISKTLGKDYPNIVHLAAIYDYDAPNQKTYVNIISNVNEIPNKIIELDFICTEIGSDALNLSINKN